MEEERRQAEVRTDGRKERQRGKVAWRKRRNRERKGGKAGKKWGETSRRERETLTRQIRESSDAEM